MSDYPTSIDTTASLGNPLDRKSTQPLETTLAAAILSSSTTIQVASGAAAGFAPYTDIVIGDEQITPTGVSGNLLTGCIRGVNGTTAAAHSSGAAVRALNIAAYYKRLQEAVIALENLVGVTGAINFAAASHNHDAAAIISGIIALARLPLMQAASAGAAGAAGLVAAPSAGDQGKYWRGDATWQTISAGSTNAGAVTFTPAGNIAATNVQAALEELDAEKAPVSHGHAASAITFTPTGAIAATTVQAAIAEVDSEKAALSHTHAAADIASGTVAVARLPVMVGASAGSAGTAGLVPTPSAGDQTTHFLRKDGTWAAVSAPATAAVNVSVAAGGAMPAGNVQDRLQDLWNDKVPNTRLVSTGAGLAGGGDLSGNLTLTADVRSVHGRTGHVTAAAGDYSATQIDASGSSFLAGIATVQQAINGLITEINAVKTDLANNYYTKSSVDAGFTLKSTYNAHSHNLNVYADGGHDHFGNIVAEPDHSHNGNTSTPV